MSSDRFDASIKRGHQVTLSNVMGRLQAGDLFALTPVEYADLSDLAGALNTWAAESPAYPQTMHAEIVRGDYSRRLFQAQVGIVDVFPFVHPGAPFANNTGVYYMSPSENPSFPGAEPWLRRLSVSTIPGDMSSKLFSDAKQPTVYVRPDDFPAGTQLYANILLLELATPGTTGSGFSIVWP